MADQLGALNEAAQRMLRTVLALLPSPERLGVDQVLQQLAQMPEQVSALQQAYYRDALALWTEALSRSGFATDVNAQRAHDGDTGSLAPAATPDAPAAAPSGQPSTRKADAAMRDADFDPRFAAPEWRTLPFFHLLHGLYELNARWLRDVVALAQLPDATRRRLRFALDQFIDAMAPSNFATTNPDAIRAAAQSGGQSIVAGLRNLERDLRAGDIARSEPGAFEVGRNLAITPGAVVHENAVAQLIRYAPITARVRSRPLLIVPPFINKYYILDLQPHNSFVRHALDRGLQVYMVSWRNPTDRDAHATWDDYVVHGVHAMIDVALEQTGARKLNVLGFCVGGTLLASALAVAPRPQAVASLTLLATLLDFGDVGDIGNYIDEAYVRQCEQDFADGGLVGGAQIAVSFASLRPRELVWSFYVDNYLKGTNPRAFDLLHWNADSANAPGPLFAWYLRNAYLENRLARPGAATVRGEPLDLRRLTMPAYVLATHDDHIVPWRSAYRGARLLPGTDTIVLGASGHVAGVINPPATGRRHYWINPARPTAPDDWLRNAEKRPGSWWTHWSDWLARHAGTWQAAPKELGSAAHAVIEAAPGRYVRVAARDAA